MSEDSPVSVIIPARDEEHNIEGVVRSLAEQSGVRQVIVVDDESSDRTPEILERLAREFARLEWLRVGSLPAGWRGKTHACAVGASRATASWLLFADADTRHKAGSVAALLALAESRGAAMLSLSPGQRMETWWEPLVIPLVFSELARLYRFEDVNNPASPAAAANGQCILIRRSAYNAVGGFEAVRGEILEDVALAKRVKASGAKLVFLPGGEWVETRMYSTFGAMWQGWTKNLFLLYDRKPLRMAAAAARLLALDSLPVGSFIVLAVLCLTGKHLFEITIALVASTIADILTRRARRREFARLGFSPRLSVYAPAGAPLVVLMTLNSLWAYRRGGSIQWRGRTYPAKGDA